VGLGGGVGMKKVLFIIIIFMFVPCIGFSEEISISVHPLHSAGKVGEMETSYHFTRMDRDGNRTTSVEEEKRFQISSKESFWSDFDFDTDVWDLMSFSISVKEPAGFKYTVRLEVGGQILFLEDQVVTKFSVFKPRGVCLGE
jgi:hypothetical protein